MATKPATWFGVYTAPGNLVDVTPGSMIALLTVMLVVFAVQLVRELRADHRAPRSRGIQPAEFLVAYVRGEA